MLSIVSRTLRLMNHRNQKQIASNLARLTKNLIESSPIVPSSPVKNLSRISWEIDPWNPTKHKNLTSTTVFSRKSTKIKKINKTKPIKKMKINMLKPFNLSNPKTLSNITCHYKISCLLNKNRTTKIRKFHYKVTHIFILDFVVLKVLG